MSSSSFDHSSDPATHRRSDQEPKILFDAEPAGSDFLQTSVVGLNFIIVCRLSVKIFGCR